MKTELLHTFLLVVDSGSIAGAARKLDLTAAAVSQQIRALERELRITLVVRAGRTLRPTEAGQRLVAQARVVLRESEALQHLARAEDTSGELRIGTINMILHSALPAALARFVAHYPNVRLTIYSETSSRLYAAIEADDIDLALCVHPVFALPKALEWQCLHEDSLVLMTPYAWSEFDAHQLLRTKPFIRYDRRLGGGKQVAAYLDQADITVNPRCELTSLTAIAMLVEQELGVAIVPDMPHALLTRMRVRKRPLPLATPLRQVGGLWQRASGREQLVRALVDEIAESHE